MRSEKPSNAKIAPEVVVDCNRCSGKGTCVEVCPSNVFELQEIKVHPETLKAVPVRVEDCIFCMEYVAKYIENAITVEENPFDGQHITDGSTPLKLFRTGGEI